jgi:hypothetical protein
VGGWDSANSTASLAIFSAGKRPVLMNLSNLR